MLCVIAHCGNEKVSTGVGLVWGFLFMNMDNVQIQKGPHDHRAR